MNRLRDYFIQNSFVLNLLIWGMAGICFGLFIAEASWTMRFINSQCMLISIVLLISLNHYILLPVFWFRKRFVSYSLLALICIAGLGIGAKELIFILSNESIQTIFLSMAFFVVLVESTLMEVMGYLRRQEQERVEAEMKFLRSQLNPHFLFNTLNNIYALSVTQSSETPANLMKLSKMLRYVLYECNQPQMPLSKELAYIQHYIDLSQLKDSRGLNVRFECTGNAEAHQVVPLLFIPFIENAFKHSNVEDIDHGWIQIAVKIHTSQLNFQVRNSLPKESYTKDAQGGIGLQNVARRLELHYPGKHQLHYQLGPGSFEVQLNIDLS